MKLIVVSNRLPYKIIDDKIVKSDGGLSSCLNNINLDFTWIGWLNKDINNKDIKSINLSKSEEERYYNNFCNKFLWYIFNNDFTRYFETLDYEFYQKVNMKFTKKIVENITSEKDIIWINDYHLFYVAKYLRTIYNIKNKIVYIHHIQLPDNIYQLNKSLPDNFMDCMKYYNLISCHTQKIKNLFHNLLKENKIHNKQIISNPIGINYEHFNKIKNNVPLFEKKKIIILGVDRLDFCKGLLNKFNAFDALLRKYPELLGKVELFQLVIPSRECINKKLKSDIERKISKINGYHTNFNIEAPIRYKYGRVNIEELVSMYKNSDICLITSFADGMNLVSLEYCICNPNGCLCLSEKAGSNEYLTGAITFNPFNLNEIVDSIYKCINFTKIDKEKLMEENVLFIKKYNSLNWSQKIMSNLMKSKKLIFCDYDGTLTPIVKNPDDASPKEKQYNILNKLCNNKDNIVHIISGRSKNTMEEWFGEVKNLTLSAEHGEFYKHNGNWINFTNSKDILIKKNFIVNLFNEKLVDLIIENKNLSVNINFNYCPEKYNSEEVKELKKEILEKFEDIKINKGLNCLEFSFSKRNKGDIVREILNNYLDYEVYAFGDEQTDEDMFKVLTGEKHYTFKVGTGKTNAKYRCENPDEVISYLTKINSNINANLLNLKC